MFTPNQYPVRLNDEQRNRLDQLTRNGHAPARKVRHAQILLWSDRNRPGGHWTDPQIADALGMHVNTVGRIRKRYVQEGEAPALDRKARSAPPVAPKIDGRAEAHLVALCCSGSPPGRARWSLRLLASEMTRRGIVTEVSHETVRQALKKTNCSPGGSSPGASRSGTARGSSPRWKTSSTCTRTSTAKKSR